MSEVFIMERQPRWSSPKLPLDWYRMPVLVGASVTFMPQRYTSNVESWESEGQMLVVSDAYIQRMRQMFDEVKKLQARLAAHTSELEIPEVFTLQPLSRYPVTVQVRKAEPARFYFVDENINLKSIED